MFWGLWCLPFWCGKGQALEREGEVYKSGLLVFLYSRRSRKQTPSGREKAARN